MVSMHEASPNLSGMQGENAEMFLWRTDLQRILQDDRKMVERVERQSFEVQLR